MARRLELAVVGLSGVLLGSSLTLLQVFAWERGSGPLRAGIVVLLLSVSLAIVLVWAFLIRRFAEDGGGTLVAGLADLARPAPARSGQAAAVSSEPPSPLPVAHPAPAPPASTREERKGWISGDGEEGDWARSPAPAWSETPSAPEPEPALSSALQPVQLLEVWETYRREGGGGFSVAGMSRQLGKAGIAAEVLAGDQVEAADLLVAVAPADSSGIAYLLPHFGKPPRSLEPWFRLSGGTSRFARIQRLIQPAVARRKGGALVLEAKGEIE